MKVLFLIPYPIDSAPSQRFRFEQYLRFLEERKIEYKVQSFLDQKTWKLLYKKGNHWKKLWGILKGFLRRDWQMLNLGGYDFVFIHREAAPIGPPMYEWWICRVQGKKVIYDFDDAIWLPNTSKENRLVAGLKWHGKVSNICRWSWKVSAGNEYLASFARIYSNNAVVMPTTIDMKYHKNESLDVSDEKQKLTPDEKIIIGWTGTHSTAPYLDILGNVFEKLSKKFDYEFSIISDRPPAKQFANCIWKPWDKETEIRDLCEIDIGIMPLSDDPWTKGKCGFKALQFMALGKPIVASPVGVNTEIIKDGVNGFLASNEKEWVDKISFLFENIEVREKIGKAGMETVKERYSVDANKDMFLGLFTGV